MTSGEGSSRSRRQGRRLSLPAMPSNGSANVSLLLAKASSQSAQCASDDDSSDDSLQGVNWDRTPNPDSGYEETPVPVVRPRVNSWSGLSLSRTPAKQVDTTNVNEHRYFRSPLRNSFSASLLHQNSKHISVDRLPTLGEVQNLRLPGQSRMPLRRSQSGHQRRHSVGGQSAVFGSPPRVYPQSARNVSHITTSSELPLRRSVSWFRDTGSRSPVRGTDDTQSGRAIANSARFQDTRLSRAMSTSPRRRHSVDMTSPPPRSILLSARQPERRASLVDQAEHSDGMSPWTPALPGNDTHGFDSSDFDRDPLPRGSDVFQTVKEELHSDRDQVAMATVSSRRESGLLLRGSSAASPTCPAPNKGNTPRKVTFSEEIAVTMT